MSRRAQGLLALGLLGLAAAVLIGIELAKGALTYGESKVADPCGQREPFPGEGLQASLQRIVLDGLDGADTGHGRTVGESGGRAQSVTDRGLPAERSERGRRCGSGRAE